MSQLTTPPSNNSDGNKDNRNNNNENDKNNNDNKTPRKKSSRKPFHPVWERTDPRYIDMNDVMATTNQLDSVKYHLNSLREKLASVAARIASLPSSSSSSSSLSSSSSSLYSSSSSSSSPPPPPPSPLTLHAIHSHAGLRGNAEQLGAILHYADEILLRPHDIAEREVVKMKAGEVRAWIRGLVRDVRALEEWISRTDWKKEVEEREKAKREKERGERERGEMVERMEREREEKLKQEGEEKKLKEGEQEGEEEKLKQEGEQDPTQ